MLPGPASHRHRFYGTYLGPRLLPLHHPAGTGIAPAFQTGRHYKTVIPLKGPCHVPAACCGDMKKKIFSPLSVVAALAIGLSGLAFSKLDQDSQPTAKVAPVALTVHSKPVSRQGPTVTSFSPVVKKVIPSVAQVTVSSKPKRIPSMDMPFSDHPWFRQFFGDDFTPERQFRTPRQHGLGSAVVVSKDGYLLTNNHVVENADEVKVTLNDGRELTARVVGKDPKTDIAVLTIDAKDLPAIPIPATEHIELGVLVPAV